MPTEHPLKDGLSLQWHHMVLSDTWPYSTSTCVSIKSVSRTAFSKIHECVSCLRLYIVLSSEDGVSRPVCSRMICVANSVTVQYSSCILYYERQKCYFVITSVKSEAGDNSVQHGTKIEYFVRLSIHCWPDGHVCKWRELNCPVRQSNVNSFLMKFVSAVSNRKLISPRLSTQLLGQVCKYTTGNILDRFISYNFYKIVRIRSYGLKLFYNSRTSKKNKGETKIPCWMNGLMTVVSKLENETADLLQNWTQQNYKGRSPTQEGHIKELELSLHYLHCYVLEQW